MMKNFNLITCLIVMGFSFPLVTKASAKEIDTNPQKTWKIRQHIQYGTNNSSKTPINTSKKQVPLSGHQIVKRVVPREGDHYNYRFRLPKDAFSLYDVNRESGVSADGKRTLYTVLKITKGKAVLNPKLRYPPISVWPNQPFPLKGLTLNQLIRIWGTPKGSEVKTFNRWAFPSSSESLVYQIDTKFKNGKLHSYRVRGKGITDTNWTTVQ